MRYSPNLIGLVILLEKGERALSISTHANQGKDPGENSEKAAFCKPKKVLARTGQHIGIVSLVSSLQDCGKNYILLFKLFSI